MLPMHDVALDDGERPRDRVRYLHPFQRNLHTSDKYVRITNIRFL